MNRRQFLAGAAIGLGTAVAGCTDGVGGLSGSGGGNSLPEYHTVLPAVNDSENAGFIHLDVGRVNQVATLNDGTESTNTATTTATRGADPATPLLTAPVIGSLFAVTLGLGFGLSGFGSFSERVFSQFEGDLASEGANMETDDDLQSITFAGGAAVFAGEFDTEANAGSLPESFTESEQRDGYTIYEDTSDRSSNIIAISGTMIVAGFGESDEGVRPAVAVNRVLDAATGAGDRFVDQFSDAGWALRTAGNHGFVLAGAGDTDVEQPEGEQGDSQYDPLAGTQLTDVDASIVVSGASITAGETEVESATADTALTHTSEPVDRSEVTETYADSDADVSVSVAEATEEGAQRVHVSAEFSSTSF